MQLALCVFVCVLIVAAMLVTSADSRISGGSHPGDMFNSTPSSLEDPRQHAPQTNGPTEFQGEANYENQKIGFDKVNPEYQQRPAGMSVPAYPARAPGHPVGGLSSPGKPEASTLNGLPLAFPGPGSAGTGTQDGFKPPPGYPGNINNTGRLGRYPNQVSGSYPSRSGDSYPEGYGQLPPKIIRGNSYGGSPFGQSNSFGTNQFLSPGFGSGHVGGFGKTNPHHSPNNFAYSSNPEFFGYEAFQPGYSGHGYHNKSRFGGLPFPIPIPIDIPLEIFGGFGDRRSYNHKVLDTFVQNKTLRSSDNLTSVFILNNSTVTPCTTDQFIYDSLNVTVMSCTADNCTAFKIFVTTSRSDYTSTYTAGVTMCLESNTTTYSSYSDVNPTFSDLAKYWIGICDEDFESMVNETISIDINETTDANLPKSNELPTIEATTTSSLDISTKSTTLSNSTESNTTNNSTGSTNNSHCNYFQCYWLKMCLPTAEVVDRCATSTTDCAATRTTYRPCLDVRMCKSPGIPITTRPSLNITISRFDQFNNITTVHDEANLILISYNPPTLPDCSQNATDLACRPPTAAGVELSSTVD